MLARLIVKWLDRPSCTDFTEQKRNVELAVASPWKVSVAGSTLRGPRGKFQAANSGVGEWEFKPMEVQKQPAPPCTAGFLVLCKLGKLEALTTAGRLFC